MAERRREIIKDGIKLVVTSQPSSLARRVEPITPFKSRFMRETLITGGKNIGDIYLSNENIFKKN